MVVYTTENSTTGFCQAMQRFILWTLTQCSPLVAPVTSVSPRSSIINSFLWLEKADGLAGEKKTPNVLRIAALQKNSWLCLPREAADLSHRRGLIATSPHSALTDNVRKTDRERLRNMVIGYVHDKTFQKHFSATLEITSISSRMHIPRPFPNAGRAQVSVKVSFPL